MTRTQQLGANQRDYSSLGTDTQGAEGSTTRITK